MQANDWKTDIRRIDWLGGVSDRELVGGRSRILKPGQVIFSPSRVSATVFFCIDGLVRIYRTWPDGSEVTLGYVGPNGVFGELAAFDDHPRESYAMAATRCTICELPTEGFRLLLEHHGTVLASVSRQIAKRLKRVESRVANLVFRDAFTRVCATLVELGEDFGSNASDRLEVNVPLTQSEFATLVGTSRQTVNVALKRLEDEGLVASQQQRFILLDVARLQGLAHGMPL